MLPEQDWHTQLHILFRSHNLFSNVKWVKGGDRIQHAIFISVLEALSKFLQNRARNSNTGNCQSSLEVRRDSNQGLQSDEVGSLRPLSDCSPNCSRRHPQGFILFLINFTCDLSTHKHQIGSSMNCIWNHFWNLYFGAKYQNFKVRTIAEIIDQTFSGFFVNNYSILTGFFYNMDI